MINFYDKLSKEDKSETKLDKHFKNHHILPNSMIENKINHLVILSRN